MSGLSDFLATVLDKGLRGVPRIVAHNSSMPRLVAALIGTSGEVSGMALAQQILDRYDTLDQNGKLDFFRFLAREMDLDPAAVRTALAEYESAPGRDSYRAFARAAEPPRQELIRRLNQLPGATARLVAMRRDLRACIQDAPEIASLDLDFRHLFTSWFNRGFLVLRPINWSSPAQILEKIIAYEAVHAIRNWEDLARRLKPLDRRCFGFFHPALPGEPLIFVEIALTKGVPGSIQTLLAEDRAIVSPDKADTAVFYSISNCQAGLAGVSFGNSLIKQVAHDLSAQLGNLKSFVTLSPIPGLNDWIGEQGGWPEPLTDQTLRQGAAHFLMDVQSPQGGPRDAVARFHLGNGASIHRVHAGADTSDKGLAQSGGAMVNYAYDLDLITRNHEGFARDGTIAASAEVRALADAGKKLFALRGTDDQSSP